ncbi:MAG: polysaccharide export protein [Gammaproteobacteria bacterium]|nr:polysaccharide export protein [Gammaproteobacteria bacterium]
MKIRWNSSAIISLLFAGLLVSGCSSAPTASTIELADEAMTPAEDYRIGPGDELEVFVWEHADLSVNVPVRPDGKISTPLVEDLKAEGKTPSELSDDLEKALSEFVRAPVVSVIVQEFRGQFSNQIRVVGQAEKPQALSYREGITLLDVMIEVGGLTQFAAGNKSKIVRRDGTTQSEMPVRLSDLMKKGKINNNVAMRPGDVLIIPESVF